MLCRGSGGETPDGVPIEVSSKPFEPGTLFDVARQRHEDRMLQGRTRGASVERPGERSAVRRHAVPLAPLAGVQTPPPVFIPHMLQCPRFKLPHTHDGNLPEPHFMRGSPQTQPVTVSGAQRPLNLPHSPKPPARMRSPTPPRRCTDAMIVDGRHRPRRHAAVSPLTNGYSRLSLGTASPSLKNRAVHGIPANVPGMSTDNGLNLLARCPHCKTDLDASVLTISRQAQTSVDWSSPGQLLEEYQRAKLGGHSNIQTPLAGGQALADEAWRALAGAKTPGNYSQKTATPVGSPVPVSVYPRKMGKVKQVAVEVISPPRSSPFFPRASAGPANEDAEKKRASFPVDVRVEVATELQCTKRRSSLEPGCQVHADLREKSCAHATPPPPELTGDLGQWAAQASGPIQAPTQIAQDEHLEPTADFGTPGPVIRNVANRRILTGLSGNPQLNGSFVEIVPPTAEEQSLFLKEGRLVVQLASGERLAVRPEKLQNAPGTQENVNAIIFHPGEIVRICDMPSVADGLPVELNGVAAEVAEMTLMELWTLSGSSRVVVVLNGGQRVPIRHRNLKKFFNEGFGVVPKG